MEDGGGPNRFELCPTGKFIAKPVSHTVELREDVERFPSSKKFHFQNEAKYETFVLEMSFICIIIKTHFHNKGFALSLVLKVKLFGTLKWSIDEDSSRDPEIR